MVGLAGYPPGGQDRFGQYLVKYWCKLTRLL